MKEPSCDGIKKTRDEEDTDFTNQIRCDNMWQNKIFLILFLVASFPSCAIADDDGDDASRIPSVSTACLFRMPEALLHSLFQFVLYSFFFLSHRSIEVRLIKNGFVLCERSDTQQNKMKMRPFLVSVLRTESRQNRLPSSGGWWCDYYGLGRAGCRVAKEKMSFGQQQQQQKNFERSKNTWTVQLFNKRNTFFHLCLGPALLCVFRLLRSCPLNYIFYTDVIFQVQDNLHEEMEREAHGRTDDELTLEQLFYFSATKRGDVNKASLLLFCTPLDSYWKTMGTSPPSTRIKYVL